ncbi:MAG TPA: matrixin family metalloprotease [Gemmatimonadaceae bacterium]|nr:matrixin family metalloprotease [Gemmatimonadaceae bacterium]
MRRGDALVAGFVGAIVVAVISLIATAPRRPEPALVVSAADSARPESTAVGAAAAGGDSARLTATTRSGHEIEVRTVRSGNPAPVRDLETIRRHLRLGAPGTYIGDILAEQDSELVRWPDETVLKVWIQPRSGVRDWNEAYVDSVQAGFRAWMQAGAPVGASFVRDSSAANVRIRWIDRFEGSYAIGLTRQTWDQYNWIVAGDIDIAMHASDGWTLPPELVRATAIHEIGHLMGLRHSSNPRDVMSATASRESLELTRADLSTLRLLYALPPGSVR